VVAGVPAVSIRKDGESRQGSEDVGS